MTGELFLLTVARLGLVFAGFTGIVGLLHRGVQRWTDPAVQWTETQIRGLQLILEFDLAAMFFALLPFPIHYTLGSGREFLLWRISGLPLICYLGFSLLFNTRRYYFTRRPGTHPKLFFGLFVVPTSFFVALETYSVVLKASFAPYAWCVFYLLIPPVIQFILFVVDAKVMSKPSELNRSQETKDNVR